MRPTKRSTKPTEMRRGPLRNCRVPKRVATRDRASCREGFCGKDHDVSPFGSAEARARYDALIAEWLSRGRVLAPADAGELSVNELVLAYWRQHVEPHYRKGGKPTSEVSCIGGALKFLKDACKLTSERDALVWCPEVSQAACQRPLGQSNLPKLIRWRQRCP